MTFFMEILESTSKRPFSCWGAGLMQMKNWASIFQGTFRSQTIFKALNFSVPKKKKCQPYSSVKSNFTRKINGDFL